MAHFLLLHLLLFTLLVSSASQPSCRDKCGSLQVQYPFGTGYGCGSPRFYPYVSCSSIPLQGQAKDQQQQQQEQEQLIFTTHSGSYPITSISYATSTFTISPPLMSTCSSMQPSHNFGLDLLTPFQLGSSAFILLSCPPPTSSLSFKPTNTPICDSSYSHLCASIHSCPAISSLGLPLFSPTDTCCVYSPANLNSKGDLDIQALHCAAYASVVSLGDLPTDPNRWEYGVELRYAEEAGFDNSVMGASCKACERSQGICGYAPPRNSFVCVCKNGVNSSVDCYGDQVAPFWADQSLASPPPLRRAIIFSTTIAILTTLRLCIGKWFLFY